MFKNTSPHLVHTGDVFGYLSVVGFSHNDNRQRRHYFVSCECGTKKTVQGTLLRTGNTKSCGCHKTDATKARRLPNDAGVIAHIILQYKRHARDRGLEFNLCHKDVDELVRLPCHYCGIVGGNLKKTKNLKDGFAHNGIDRVDSAKSYHLENVVPCCGLCNRAKRAMSRPEFISWAIRVADHQKAMAEQWGKL